MWDTDPTIAVLSTTIAGVESTGAVTLRVAETHDDETATGVRLLRLGVDGNIVWAKHLEGDAIVPSDGLSAAARVFADGSTTLYYKPESESESYIERLDAAGNSVERVRLPSYGGGTPIFDSDARLVVANMNDAPPRVLIAGGGSASCTVHELAVSRCPEEPNCGGRPSVALDPAENLYFGIGDAVGLARLP
jgi:hypothetical protein